MQENNNYLNTAKYYLHKEELYDVFLYESNGFLFNYGNHLLGSPDGLVTFKSRIKLKTILINAIFSFFTKNNSRKFIISNAYVDLNLGHYDFIHPPWSTVLNKGKYSFDLYKVIYKLSKLKSKKSLKILYSKEFYMLLEKYRSELKKLVSSQLLEAAFFSNDMSFFENISILFLNQLNVPTFVYLHGLPARYNNLDDNRAKYLIVWGKGIKRNYINVGVPAEKILVLRHPVYNNFKCENLRSSLERVLVLSKAVSGTPSSSDKLILPNRSISLTYLENVKSMLKQIGIKKAKLRLHPSERVEFYTKNLVDDFYTISNDSKDDALNKATLVVGPSSTMVLDAVIAGVNYILFDPIDKNGINLEGLKLVSPFDGSAFLKLSNDIRAFDKNINNPSNNINLKLLNEFFEVEISELNLNKIT